MEKLYRKILLEDVTDRAYDSPTWGEIPKDTNFYINIMLTQSTDTMGMFTDIEYVGKSVNTPPNYTLLRNKLQDLGLSFPFMDSTIPLPVMNPYTNRDSKVLKDPTKSESNYYNFLNTNARISGYTDSKVEDLRTYSEISPYIIDFDINSETYTNYSGISGIKGVDRVKSVGLETKYVFNSPTGSTQGTQNQIHGMRYIDISGQTRNVEIEGDVFEVPLTEMHYIGEGWNMTNTSLSGLTKEEYLFGIISPPEVESDVFIDRGITSVMDKHLRLSEVKNIGELTNHGNGFYKINKQ
jgi:hypothetical protein